MTNHAGGLGIAGAIKKVSGNDARVFKPKAFMPPLNLGRLARPLHRRVRVSVRLLISRGMKSSVFPGRLSGLISDLIPVSASSRASMRLYFQPEVFPRKRSTLGRLHLCTDGL